jgi:hypothetical protein
VRQVIRASFCLIEVAARDRGIALADEHSLLRSKRPADLLESLRTHLERFQRQFPANSDFAVAGTHTLKHSNELARFVNDVRVYLDDNGIERDLRRITLGGAISRFGGSADGGEDIGILKSLVTSCVQSRVSSEQYLADLLIRNQTWPYARIDELLQVHGRRRTPGGEGPPSGSRGCDYGCSESALGMRSRNGRGRANQRVANASARGRARPSPAPALRIAPHHARGIASVPASLPPSSGRPSDRPGSRRCDAE